MFLLHQATYVADVDAVLVVAFDAIGDAALGEDLVDFAIQADDVVVAWVVPASAALADGVGVHAEDVLAGEVDAGEGGGAMEDDAGDGAHREKSYELKFRVRGVEKPSHYLIPGKVPKI